MLEKFPYITAQTVKVEAYFAFETKEKAVAFEAYLKTGSGHALAQRHF